MPKSGMKSLSEEEAHTGFSHTPRDSRSVNIDFYSDPLQDVGSADRRARCPITVLRHGYTARRNGERGHG
jgi:hypothetical protein